MSIKVGDLVFNTTRRYSITNYRTFFVGLVVEIDGGTVFDNENASMTVVPLYLTKGSSISNYLFKGGIIPDDSPKLTRYLSCASEFRQRFLPHIMNFFTDLTDMHPHRLSNSLYHLRTSPFFTTYSVESQYFTVLNIFNLHQSFEDMIVAQRQNGRFDEHEEYGDDYIKIREEYIRHMSYFLRQSAHSPNSFDIHIINPIQW